MASAVKLGDADLLRGEVPLKSWTASTATWGPFGGYGTLHLTNRRLVWVKGRFNIFPVPHEIAFDLDDIDRCRAWTFIVRQFIRIRLTNGRQRSFEIHWGIRGAKVAADINGILQEGSPDHG